MAKALGLSKPLKFNLSHRQRTALSNLSKDEMIVIFPADKGNATMVMDRSVSEEKLKSIVGDDNTYRKLSRDPTTRVEKKVADAVR